LEEELEEEEREKLGKEEEEVFPLTLAQIPEEVMDVVLKSLKFP
jgi:hypothetical protein